VRAFPFASALSFGLEGIPLHCRPYTNRAMLGAGYVAHDDWGYHIRDTLYGDWPGPDLADIEVDAEGLIRLRVRHSQRVVAEAHVQIATDGTGIGWWLHVEPEMQGIGMGRVVFNQAMRELARRGATHAVLLVDDGPTAENSRDRAKRIYWTAGFRERDRLINYEKAPVG
jgi:ribosomal protein S18 acetylase RimI-like enzyme